MTVHRGNKIVELDIQPVGGVDRVVAYLPREGNAPVAETDSFNLEEGQQIRLQPKSHGYKDMGLLGKKAIAKLRKIWVWTQGKEKRLELADYQFNVYEFTGKLEPLFLDDDAKPDADLQLTWAAIILRHLPGAVGHADYKFSVQLDIGEKSLVWDPDVHDVGPGG